jgi:hypothetical protein
MLPNCVRIATTFRNWSCCQKRCATTQRCEHRLAPQSRCSSLAEVACCKCQQDGNTIRCSSIVTASQY